MASINWPTIRTTHPNYFRQKIYNPGFRNTMSSGKIISRKKFSSPRYVFTLGWPALPDADYATLVTFFETYPTTLFNFTHPRTGYSHECIFMDDELPEGMPMDGYYELTGVKIMEIA